MNTSLKESAEEEEKEKLLFSLTEPASPTVVFIHVNNIKKEQELLAWFQTSITNHQHHILDVSSEYVESLFERLLHFKETLGHQLNTLDFVHVIGLENSIMRYEKGVKIMQPLLANMNFERELFFNKLNFSTVLWADSSFFKELNKQAPDFTHWVTRWFEFTAPLENEEIRNKPLVEPKSRGNIPERSQYIQDLLDKFESLNFTANDTTRRIEDQITLLEAIGREYEKQSDYKNSIHYLKRALDLAKKIEATNSIAKLQFYLGTSYLEDRQFEQSLASYLNCLEICGTENFGSTYHQIGMVYEEQRNWTQALENYQLAIQWYEKTGNDYELGGTYHQIGIVYAEQRNWTQALENYQLAIQWKEKTGNDYELGDTYHQIGRVYEEQRNWTQALDNYQLAIQWNEKSGNDYALGNTYHQIGRVYEEQRNWVQALEFLEKSIENFTLYDHPHLSTAIASRDRVEGKMSQP